MTKCFFFSDYEKAIELFEKTQEKVGAIILKKETLVELLSVLLELNNQQSSSLNILRILFIRFSNSSAEAGVFSCFSNLCARILAGDC